MKIRATSIIKLTNDRVNMDYTFVKGTKLEHVIKQLLVEFCFQNSKEEMLSLSKEVADSI